MATLVERLSFRRAEVITLRWEVSVRTLTSVLAAFGVVALLLYFAPDDVGLVAALKLIAATVGVGVFPGAVILLGLRPIEHLSMLEVLALGFAVSLALVQLLTIVSLTLHLSAVSLGLATLAICGVLMVGISRRRDARMLVLGPDELIIGVLAACLAIPLYLKGSPVSTGEDLIHIAVVRRLAVLAHPAIDNIYYAPGLVYTYPFPGTHFFLALVSQLSNVDPLLIYQKLRFIWGPAAILYVYIAARLVFGGRELPFVVGIVAILFTFGGAFADVPLFSWAQLAPFSHASDVAMNVLLPAVMVLTLLFLQATQRRGALFFSSAALSLVFMLVIVHIREVVQYAVYLGSFLLVAIVLRRGRREQLRLVVLLGGTIAMTLGYVLWHKYSVGHIDTVVEARRAILIEHIGLLQPADLWRTPFLDNYFATGFSAFFYGWFPIVLFASPILVYLLRDRPYVLSFGMCIFVYLLILRLPILSIPYVYVTYYEILFTPVRNIVLFVYVFAGALFYVLAKAIARIKSSAAMVAASLGAAAALVAAWRGSAAVWDHLSVQQQSSGGWVPALDLFFVPFFILYLVAFVLAWWGSRRTHGESAWRPASVRDWRIPATALVGVAALASISPASSPLNTIQAPIGGLQLSDKLALTPRDIVQKFQCITQPPVDLPKGELRDRMGAVEVVQPENATSCPPNFALMNWARTRVAGDAVLEINTFNRYSPAPFLPQQIVAWPAADSSGLYWEEIFPVYFEHFQRTMQASGVQPMFNSVEGLNDRLAFAHDLGATHVLVDPMYYKEMKRVLGQWPDHFQSQYDDGDWIVYAIRG